VRNLKDESCFVNYFVFRPHFPGEGEQIAFVTVVMRI
jgi:hypothetical protein